MNKPAQLQFTSFGSRSHSPLMLLHGFMGSSKDWHDVLETLAKSYFCIAVDLPWHGDSPPLRFCDNPFDQTASALRSILETQHIKKSALLGYSMGGRIAMYAATRHPNIFGPLIIESASPGIQGIIDLKSRQKQDRIIGDRLRHDNFDYFMESWYEQPLFESLRRHPNFERMHRSRLQNKPAFLADSIRALGAGVQPSLWNDIEKYPNSVLMLVGEFDKKYRGIATMLQRRRPQTLIKIIPECGHNIHFENSTIFCKKTMQFLNIKM